MWLWYPVSLPLYQLLLRPPLALPVRLSKDMIEWEDKASSLRRQIRVDQLGRNDPEGMVPPLIRHSFSSKRDVPGHRTGMRVTADIEYAILPHGEYHIEPKGDFLPDPEVGMSL